MSAMIGLLTAAGAILDPLLLAVWILGSAVWAGLLLAGWKFFGDVYGRDTIRYAVALVLLWPVIYTAVAVQRAFARRLPSPGERPLAALRQR